MSNALAPDVSERSSNRGRWGAEDQRGALNLLTPEVVVRALGGTAGRVVSLGLPLQAGRTPNVAPRPGIVHTMLVDGGDFEAGSRRGKGGFQFADDYLAMPVHTGTHLDALSHVGRDGELYNGFSTREIRSARGAGRLGIEHVGGLVTRAVVLDIAGALGLEALQDGHQISVSDIELALVRAGTTIQAGDAVLLHTGWLRRFRAGDHVSYVDEPGLGLEAASWLVRQDVVLIGADNWGVEAAPSADGTVMPVHLLCLVDYGVYLMEFVDLDPLLDAGVSSCALVVAALPIAGGAGSPVNPIAIF